MEHGARSREQEAGGEEENGRTGEETKKLIDEDKLC